MISASSHGHQHTVDVCAVNPHARAWSLRTARACLVFGLLACDTNTNTSTDNALDQANPDPPAPTFTLTWGEDAIDIPIDGGDGRRFWFGAVEGDDWTGEDCYLGDSVDGTAVRYCHLLPEAGGSLAFGGDPLDLVAGEETALDPDRRGRTRVYFVELESAACWVGGARLSYYDDVCTNEGAITTQ